MHPKERLHRAIAGEPTDVIAVAPAYLSLYLDERIQKLYLQAYERKLAGKTSCAIDHVEDSHFRANAILHAYEIFEEQPDWIHTEPGESLDWAARGEMRLEGGRINYVDKLTGECTDWQEPGRLMLPTSTRYAYRVRTSRMDVWDESADLHTRADIEALVPIRTAEELEAQGIFEVTRSLAHAVGDRMPLSYIAPTPFWSTYSMLGFQGMLLLLRANPDLFRYLMERRHQQRLEILKGLGRAGLDIVWIEECLSSADLISPRDYDEFAFPTTQALIAEVKRLGLKTVLYYCGDVIPRLPRLKQLGMDALAVEESKKGFSVDIGDVIEQVDGACCVFGNVDSIHVVQLGTPQMIEAEARRQIELGKKAKGFVLSQGSPFPLDTEPHRVDVFARSTRQPASSS